MSLHESDGSRSERRGREGGREGSGSQQRGKEGAIRREESGEGRSSWSPTLHSLSPSLSLLHLGRKKSALNVTTTPHAFSLALMVPLLHTLSPYKSTGVGEKLA